MTTTARIASLKRTLSKVQARTREVREFTRPGQTIQARRAWEHIRSLAAEIRRLELTA